ncbi:AAA family ATPase [uncultured Selenomonas sp.]|uniref:ATP-binding protein n=1 Tax=uncultured Selenomonas sp. TaxID=159275 RepID=UPI0028D236DD|nr:AAA family ATPase [uncultured Selenomonas sp.]
MKKRATYPFAAIVGQEEMKTALLMSIVMPMLGGVLIKGEKGTAKSTAVRAAAALLPDLHAVRGCACRCDPAAPELYCDACQTRAAEGTLAAEDVSMRVVELPVSATEDRVVGTLDMEAAIQHGRKEFEPGILAAANRNILYVDEINLLEDHIVDILLDSAAMGVNTVEREGISYAHPARFVLIGTMNPEEGDIRPQLLDRFALSVTVAGERDAQTRVEVIRRRIAYERDPDAFAALYAGEQEALRAQILDARARAAHVDVPDEILDHAAQISLSLGVDGHRADITLIKAGIAHAALAGHGAVTAEDLRRVSRLVLAHRMRRRPFEEGAVDWTVVDAILGGAA